MIQIDDKIVSTDLLTEKFCCDPSRCKGACCVEGNAGAPLEAEEIEILEREYETYKPYLKPEGIAAIERQAFMVVDRDGDYTTPLIGDAECAEGRTGFVKPISCHLYPIRVAVFGNGSVGLNYHRWNICKSACLQGRQYGVPVYRALRTAIVRRFGEPFFQALEEAESLLNRQNDKK